MVPVPAHTALQTAAVGDRIYFAEERRPYRIQARSARFLVATKPHFGTVLYTIVDLDLDERGPEDLVFGMGAETRAQCEAMVARVEARETGLSRRRSCPLHVVAVHHG